jgi:thiamine biosynthesis lipoprotein
MFQITLYAPDQTAADHAAEAAFRRIAELDDIMTDYDPRSELMQLCARPPGTPVPVSKDLFGVLRQSEIVAEKSGGAFDITVGPFVRLWRNARKTRTLPTPAEIAKAAVLVGHEKISLDPHQQTATLAVSAMKLDLGGIAKGLAADEALIVLRQKGVNRAMVAASGDIAVSDPPPGHAGWAIGIQSIDRPAGGLSGEVLLKNAGISTSGDTEQYVEIDGQRFSHIVDPKTGLGLTERIGVTIVAPNGTLSDSLATAVSVMGEKRGLALVESWPGVSALMVKLTPAGKESITSRRFQRLPRR